MVLSLSFRFFFVFRYSKKSFLNSKVETNVFFLSPSLSKYNNGPIEQVMSKNHHFIAKRPILIISMQNAKVTIIFEPRINRIKQKQKSYKTCLNFVDLTSNITYFIKLFEMVHKYWKIIKCSRLNFYNSISKNYITIEYSIPK